MHIAIDGTKFTKETEKGYVKMSTQGKTRQYSLALVVLAGSRDVQDGIIVEVFQDTQHLL